MQGFSLWARCRPRLAPSQWIGLRFRTGGAKKPPKSTAPSSRTGPPLHGKLHGKPAVSQSYSDSFQGLEDVNALPTTILLYFRYHVKTWTLRRSVHDRLVSFGAPSADVTKLLAAFSRDAAAGTFDTPDALEKYDLVKLRGSDATEADVTFSNIFFRWLETRSAVEGVDPRTTALLLRLAEAASNMYPAEEYPAARMMRRKIIMHVGPTNSGKTHHALRALAAAKVGVYAGPLRLLAHEIWERLNLGQIVPAGATDEQIAEAAKFGSSTDSPFARPTNMITGEEQKIVLPPNTNGLISCTVEMLHIHSQYDVAVIDEIQMISDRERGQGWLRAVMGLCAREVHLCGEETAVPLIEELLKATGDEIVVKRYDRLTPLVVEETSLESDLSRVRKGDCIVAFSRTAIFALKRQIEKLTDIKCAVVYGKLPPEIRSEQAALFNDPDSGYDVLIGSDAIGMGLNLKIRRIIFEAIHKYDGKSMSLLSLSQMKQIAGRAGRFGMQDVNEKPGGFVTTLSAEDLPVLRETLLIGTPSLAYARLALTREDFQRIAAHLPPNASTETMYLAHMHAGRLPSCYRNSVPNMLKAICEYLDNQGYFTLADRVLFMQAPFPWRDRVALEAITRFITAYYQSMHVPLIETMNNLPYLRTLEEAEEAMDSKDGHKAGGRSFSAAQQLEGLEIFHKILVVYLWLSYRNPVSYPSYDLTLDWKERLERVLHWCLQEMTQYRGLRPEAVKPNRVPIEWKSKRQLALEVQTELRLQNEAEPNLPKKSKRQLAAEFAERFSVDGSPAPP